MEKLEEPKNLTMMINSVALLEWLLYDLNAATEEGRAPLHFAAMYDCFEAAEFLVGNGADNGPQSKAGQTPFEIAVGRRSTKVAGLLQQFEVVQAGEIVFPEAKAVNMNSVETRSFFVIPARMKQTLRKRPKHLSQEEKARAEERKRQEAEKRVAEEKAAKWKDEIKHRRFWKPAEAAAPSEAPPKPTPQSPLLAAVLADDARQVPHL
jgi:hypothetical protein